MASTLIIDPVTRIEGHLKVEVTIDNVKGSQQITDARVSGTLYRGFENLLAGRDPLDAQHITQRICGVCPTAHGMAAVKTLDAAFRAGITNNGRIIRNLILGSDFIQSHILHFYHLTLPDFIDGPNMPPWQPNWASDKRFDAASTETLQKNYIAALDIRRKAHEMGAIFGGKMPIAATYIPGGVTVVPGAEQISRFKAYLTEIANFITNTYIPDVERVAAVYNDYYTIGSGPGTLMAYGVFDLNLRGTSMLLRGGIAMNGSKSVRPVDLNSIAESVKYSWYADSSDGLNPHDGTTSPQYPKADGYSWLKAPRYQGLPVEVGPLARMWVNGDYRRGISTMDRHSARAYETKKIAEAMQSWIDQIALGRSVFRRFSIPSSADAYGLTEAPRGALGHWLQIAEGRIARYQIITPTCWNASPKDATGTPGPIEEALIGTPVENIDEPVEVVRVIHSFDPCLACAVHVVRLNDATLSIVIGGNNA